MSARTLLDQQAYLAACIADEVAIAKLLGWKNITPPAEIAPTSRILGDKFRRASIQSRTQISSMLPRWRRAWDGVGELISLCALSIKQSERGVIVTSGEHICPALYCEHPSKDDAIRFAMCQVAIAALRQP